MLNFYSLYDVKTQHYHIPFYAHTDAEALAIIRDQVSSDVNPCLLSALDDLKLYYIGTFDPEVGQFDPDPHFVDFDLSSFRKEERA